MKGFAANRAGREGFATAGHADAAPTRLFLWFDAYPVIHCRPNAPLPAEVSLGRLNRVVSVRSPFLSYLLSSSCQPAVVSLSFPTDLDLC